MGITQTRLPVLDVGFIFEEKEKKTERETYIVLFLIVHEYKKICCHMVISNFG